MSAPPDRAEIDRQLRQSRRIEVAAKSEIMSFAALQASLSPWTEARRLRMRVLADEIEADLRALERHRRDLTLRLRLNASAVQAARAYAKATGTDQKNQRQETGR